MAHISLDGTSSAGAMGGLPYKALCLSRGGGVLVSYLKSLYSAAVAGIHDSRGKVYVYIFNFTIVPHLPKRVHGRHKEVYIRGLLYKKYHLSHVYPRFGVVMMRVFSI
jgi:hypothetical protein